MSISFNDIPANILTPGIYWEFDSSRAVGTPGAPHRALIIAQKLTTGTLAAETPSQVFSSPDGEKKAGRGSILDAMVKAFKTANPYTELWVIALDDDGAATAATGKVSIAVTTAKAGTIYLYIAGKLIRVAVSDGDTDSEIAAAMVAAINADSELPVTAAVNGTNAYECDITARNKGTLGNKIDIRINYRQGEELPSGVTPTITAMASGATDPDLTNAVAALADTQYHTLVSALSDDTNLDVVEAELATRWGPTVQKEGHLFVAEVGTLSAITTAGNARNSKHSALMGGGKSPTPPWIWAATLGAVDAFETEKDPARPRQTLLLPGVLPPADADLFTREERNTLLTDGVSTFTANAGQVFIERLITTYQTNPLGAPDTSYLNLTTVRLLARLRYDRRTRLAAKYPRHKLADDGTLFAPGQAVVTPSVIKGELIAIYGDWELNGWCEGSEQFVSELLVERNATDKDRLDVRDSPNLINSFRVLAGQTQFLL